MHPSTRILLCRLGVVLFCLLPTAIVGAWLVGRSSDGYLKAQKQEWEHKLTQRLGLIVEIGEVRYPAYAAAVLEDVRLLDPETNEALASIPLLEIVSEGEGWRIELSQPQVDARHMDRLSRTLEDRLLCSPADGLEVCRFSARELTIVDGESGLTLVNVVGEVQPGKGGPAIHLEFALPAADRALAPVCFMAARNRAIAPPATTWHLDNSHQPLPCSLLAQVRPELSRLGRDCRFAGTVTVVDTPPGISAELSGVFDQVDLDTLVTEHFPHQLSGMALVRIERATIDAGRLVALRGTVQAQNGSISHSLLAAGQEHLQLSFAAGNGAVQPGRAAPYRQLSLGFDLSDRALALSGSADPTHGGILLANAAGPLLEAPEGHAVPAVNLLRTLLPENQYQVPATRQTDVLVGLLPVPDLAPSRTASDKSRHTPTRLAPSAPLDAAPAIRQPVLR
jgi:hypothetical protein